MKCPYCGKGDLNGWQSKDGPCVLCDHIDYRTVYNFYTFCDACKQWVEFVRTDARDMGDFCLVPQDLDSPAP